jgi:hypothetical protein
MLRLTVSICSPRTCTSSTGWKKKASTTTSSPCIHECGARSKKVKSHLAYYEHPGGGAVSSVGSIAWAGSLSNNQCSNNVSRITENVLRKFLAD